MKRARWVLITAALLWAAAAVGWHTVAAQAPAPAGKVDFGRDVRPIFQQHCIGCHGPSLALNNLRLDRRKDALRGGNISDIQPGNSSSSRLYLRLLPNSRFGIQMPPTAPLSAEQIDVIKRWLDEGAVWPDEFSGDAPPIPADPVASRLMAALRTGDTNLFRTTLAANPRAAQARGEVGDTPLMFASFYGSAESVDALLKAGANPNAKNDAGATALMWAIGNPAKLKLLLDAGADPNVRSEDGRTALVIAAGRPGLTQSVTLLLERGATANVKIATDLTPLREAARMGDDVAFKAMLDHGADLNGLNAPPANFVRANCAKCAEFLPPGTAPAAAPAPNAAPPAPAPAPAATAPAAPVPERQPVAPTPATIRAAIERSVPLLQKHDVSFIRQTGCVSCHHNSLPAMAVVEARKSGFRVDEAMAALQVKTVAAYIESWRQRAMEGIGIAGGQDSVSYIVFGVAVEKHESDAATDAMSYYLLGRQSPDGRWRIAARRPPIESSDIEVTALTMRILQVYAPKPMQSEYAAAVDRARTWLMTAEPQNTEDRAFQVLGLAWAGVTGDALDRAVRGLVAEQRPDGGWAQIPTRASDAYATGQVLFALQESGALKSTDAVSRSAVQFLLTTQEADGSWHVVGRANPVQPLFESGFPHGRDQWISAAATGWATAALARAAR